MSRRTPSPTYLLPISLGFSGGILFWFFHAATNAFIANKGTFTKELFNPELQDIYAYLIVTLGSIIFSVLYTRAIRAEQGLRSSQDRLNRIEAQAQLGAWERNLATNELIWSEQMYRLVGLSPGEPIGNYDYFLSFIHPDDRGLLKNLVNQTISTGHPYATEYRLRRKDGVERIIWATGEVIRDKRGKPVRLVGSAQDITAKKLGESAVRDSEARVRLLLDSTAEGIFGMDRDGVCTFANRSCAALLGYAKPEELIGKAIHALIHHTKENGFPLEFSECSARIALREQKETHTSDDLFWKADGTSIHVEYWVRPIFSDGTLTGTVNTFVDISARRATQLALTESESRLRTIFQIEPECLKMLDRQGHVLKINSAGLKMIGANGLDEILGHTLYPIILEPYRERFIELTDQVFRGESGQLEFEVMTLKGERRWFETNAAPMFDPLNASNVTALVGVTRDITEHKRAEAEIIKARDQAESAVRLRDEFISIASHELKTPLTSLRLNLQLMQKTTDELFSNDVAILSSEKQAALRKKLQKMLTGSKAQSSTLTDLINTLLDVTRIRAGKIDLKFDEVDVVEVLKEVIASHAPQIERTGIAVTVEASSSVVGHWDRGRIRQIITNLLSNALKYGNKKPIEIRVVRTSELARIEVEDQGLGIPPDQQAKIFERFERASASRSIGGLGLGLYITRQLANAHLGTVRVKSELGRGTTFIVELPLRPADAKLESDQARSRETA